ncbi:MAG: recombinase family protein [Chloroflexi bacterium]|nr:recombinase family protein [Chloroflexota bacterium]
MKLDFQSFANLEKPVDVLKYLQSLVKTSAPLQKNAVIYIRKSRMLIEHGDARGDEELNPGGEKTYSLQFQEQVCRDLAAKQDWNAVGVFIDRNRSGKNSKREEFQNMKFLIESGGVDYVLVYSSDRSFRNGMSLMQFVSRLHQMNVGFVSATEPLLDGRTLFGRMMLICIAALSEIPVWNASERAREAKAVRLKSGLPNGGYRYGYCNGLCKTCKDPNGKAYCPLYGEMDRLESKRGTIQVPHPIEQYAVRLIAHLYSLGLSDLEIAKYLNSNMFELPDRSQVHFRTKGLLNQFAPGEFTRDSVREIVRNPFYVGYVMHYYTAPLNMNDDLDHPERIKNPVCDRRKPERMEIGQHTPLYPVLIWKRNMQLRASKRGTPTTQTKPGRTYLLSGIARCWECYDHDGRNAGLRGLQNGNGHQKYRCATLLDKHHFTPAVVDAKNVHENAGVVPSSKCKYDDLLSLHPKIALFANKLDEQVSQLVERLVVPSEWHEGVAAYYLSDKGMSEYETKSRNLHQELERYKTLLLSGHIDKAEFDEHGLRLHREIQKMQPTASKEAKVILPLLNDFQNLWKQFNTVERRALLKVIFSGLYFDKQGNLRKVIAYSPFDKLLGLDSD